MGITRDSTKEIIEMIEQVPFLILGAVTGIFAGLFGVGGGIVLVPALVWLFHFNQHQAQGMSLAALLLPVGIFGFMTYYKANPFPIKSAFIIALGILIGTYVGGLWAQKIPERQLKISFGILMIVAAIKMIFGK